MHSPCEAGGLVLQRAGIHAEEALVVNLNAGVLAACLGGAVEAAYQPVRTLATDAQVDIRVGLADCNLGNHLLDTVYLYGALLQYAPDFLDQFIDYMFVEGILRRKPLHNAAALITNQSNTAFMHAVIHVYLL